MSTSHDPQPPTDDAGDRFLGDQMIHRRPNPLFGPGPIIVENVFFSKVGHTFGPLPFPPPHPMSGYIVQDFLLDDTHESNCDGEMAPTTQFDLTATTRFRFNVFPRDRSRRVKVTVPAGAQVLLGFNVGRKFVNAASDTSDTFTPTALFQYLVGAPPTLTYRNFNIGHSTNHWVEFEVHGQVTQPVKFFSFVVIGDYPPRTFDPGTKTYVPFSSSVPYNLHPPGGEGVPYLLFSYRTQSPVDPGPFVLLE